MKSTHSSWWSYCSTACLRRVRERERRLISFPKSCYKKVSRRNSNVSGVSLLTERIVSKVQWARQFGIQFAPVFDHALLIVHHGQEHRLLVVGVRSETFVFRVRSERVRYPQVLQVRLFVQNHRLWGARKLFSIQSASRGLKRISNWNFQLCRLWNSKLKNASKCFKILKNFSKRNYQK